MDLCEFWWIKRMVFSEKILIVVNIEEWRMGGLKYEMCVNGCDVCHRRWILELYLILFLECLSICFSFFFSFLFLYNSWQYYIFYCMHTFVSICEVFRSAHLPTTLFICPPRPPVTHRVFLLAYFTLHVLHSFLSLIFFPLFILFYFFFHLFYSYIYLFFFPH